MALWFTLLDDSQTRHRYLSSAIIFRGPICSKPTSLKCIALAGFLSNSLRIFITLAFWSATSLYLVIQWCISQHKGLHNVLQKVHMYFLLFQRNMYLFSWRRYNNHVFTFAISISSQKTFMYHQLVLTSIRKSRLSRPRWYYSFKVYPQQLLGTIFAEVSSVLFRDTGYLPWK